MICDCRYYVLLSMIISCWIYRGEGTKSVCQGIGQSAGSELGRATESVPLTGQGIVQSAGSELGRATESVPLTGQGIVQSAGSELGRATESVPLTGQGIVQSAGSELGRATESVPLTGEGVVESVGGYRRPTESFLAVPRIGHKLRRSSSLPNLSIPRHSTEAPMMDSDGKHHTGDVLMGAIREGPSLEMMDSDDEHEVQNAIAVRSTEIEELD
ncbi:hypothetical protein Hdeb2414_s0008g00272371 [Helianthus debilis subsp. tardiflorus]